MQLYKQYNQEQLNLQYNIRLHVPDFETYFEKWETLSRRTEKKLPIFKDIPYGDLPRECLDVFPSGLAGSKTLLFIHGGYWQRFDKSMFHFIAGAFAKYGVTTVLMNYPLAPAATMDGIVTSCQKALHWLQDNCSKMNGDANQLFIAGHSAGAHLAAMLLTKEKPGSNQPAVKGVCAISGLFNLIPVQLSNINDVVQMDKEMALKNSPAFLVPPESGNLLLAVGDAETVEFKDQSRELYGNWKNKIRSIETLPLPGLHHLSIVDSIQDSNSLLHTAMCKLMNI
jgi:arylformamidase